MPNLRTRIAEISSQCVACGCCEKICPLGAITIYKGMYAKVDDTKCVGCGKCKSACPASVITLKNRREGDS